MLYLLSCPICDLSYTNSICTMYIHQEKCILMKMSRDKFHNFCRQNLFVNIYYEFSSNDVQILGKNPNLF